MSDTNNYDTKSFEKNPLNENSFDKEAFLNTLVSLRKKHGLTQAALAEVLGVSDKAYSKWETGETEPSLTALSRLAAYYQVSPSVFFGGKNLDSMELAIRDVLKELAPADAVLKSFELQFYAIRGLAAQAFKRRFQDEPVEVAPPPNRVNHTRGITAYAATDVYTMMYNGTDANIALSLLPGEDKYDWLTTQRDRLSEYLSLIGDADMLRCLPLMLSEGFSGRYTAEYLAHHAGIDTGKATELLSRATALGICEKTVTHMGEGMVELFATKADSMLLGILCLAHLSLPGAEKNGHYYFGEPCRISLRDAPMTEETLAEHA